MNCTIEVIGETIGLDGLRQPVVDVATANKCGDAVVDSKTR